MSVVSDTDITNYLHVTRLVFATGEELPDPQGLNDILAQDVDLVFVMKDVDANWAKHTYELREKQDGSTPNIWENTDWDNIRNLYVRDVEVEDDLGRDKYLVIGKAQMDGRDTPGMQNGLPLIKAMIIDDICHWGALPNGLYG